MNGSHQVVADSNWLIHTNATTVRRGDRTDREGGWWPAQERERGRSRGNVASALPRSSWNPWGRLTLGYHHALRRADGGWWAARREIGVR
jgi:hypothetical protein